MATSAAAAFERLVPGDIAGLAEGRLRYTVLTDDRGGVLDDLIAGPVPEGLFVVANAARREADLAHMAAALEPAHRVEELAGRALLAVQGPAAAAVLERLCPASRDARLHADRRGQGRRRALPDRPLRLHRRGRLRDLGCRYGRRRPRPPAPGRAGGRSGWSGRPRFAPPRGRALPVRPRADARDHPDRGRARLDDRQTAPARRRLPRRRDHPCASSRTARPESWSGSAPKGGRRPAKAPRSRTASGARIGEVTSGGFGPTIGGPIALGYVTRRTRGAGDRRSAVDPRQAAPGQGGRPAVRSPPLPALMECAP